MEGQLFAAPTFTFFWALNFPGVQYLPDITAFLIP